MLLFLKHAQRSAYCEAFAYPRKMQRLVLCLFMTASQNGNQTISVEMENGLSGADPVTSSYFLKSECTQEGPLQRQYCHFSIEVTVQYCDFPHVTIPQFCDFSHMSRYYSFVTFQPCHNTTVLGLFNCVTILQFCGFSTMSQYHNSVTFNHVTILEFCDFSTMSQYYSSKTYVIILQY